MSQVLTRLREEAGKVRRSDFTATVRSDLYPAVSPQRPELDQSGRTVLITGGGTGIGLSIAKSFVAAKAAKVAIVGRRAERLASAHAELEAEAQRLSSPTVIVHRKCDVTVESEVDALWADPEIGQVDVLVLNAAMFQFQPNPLVKTGIKAVWAMYEANVKGPLYMTEKFQNQTTSDGKPVLSKSIINVSTAAIHVFDRSFSALLTAMPSYGLTKNSFTLALQLVANDVAPEETQIVSFHPGSIFNDNFIGMGVSPDDRELFDDAALPGGFAVWAASPEARFLHGRFAWSAWDVEELASGQVRKHIDGDFDYLKIGVVGIKGNSRAY